jgi:S-adenosylmethionine decarboxylase
MRATMHNFSDWIEATEPEKLKEFYQSLLEDCGFTVITQCEKHFEPYGYTALYLLGESHFAIHTFPEHQTAYIELSSCVREPFLRFVRAADPNHVHP